MEDARDGEYMALLCRLIAIAIAGGIGLSRARAGGEVVISSFEELYGVAERSTRQSSEPCSWQRLPSV